jgi:hypothetical protein
MKKILVITFAVLSQICNAQIGPYPSGSLTFTTGVVKTGSVVKVDTSLISTKLNVISQIGNKVPYTLATSDVNLNVKNLFNVRTFDSVYIGLGGGSFVTNIAIGNGALTSNTTGQGVIAIGKNALHSNTTSSDPTNTNGASIAIGNNTLYSLTTASGPCIAIGDSCLMFNTASGNEGVGIRALSLNTSGAKNTAVGYQCMNLNTTGSQNTAYGNQAFLKNRTGSDNCVFGYFALGTFGTNGNPSRNTAIGSGAAYSCSSCANNIVIGYDAAGSMTTGSQNVYIGNQSAATTSNLTGSGNIYLGYDVGRTVTNGTSNKIMIHNSNVTLPLIGGDMNTLEVTIGGALNTNLATVASATTLTLTSASSYSVTGTTTITGIAVSGAGDRVGTEVAGGKRTLIFAGACQLTNNATSFILPNGANYTTAAGDVFDFIEVGTAGNWKCIDYTLSSGGTLNNAQTTVSNSTSGTTVFSEPQTGTSYKKVIIYLNAALGTASYTYPVAFTNTPSIFASNDVAAGIITSISTTALTVTGTTTTGFITVEGY